MSKRPRNGSNARHKCPWSPASKTLDADMAQTQLREAAEEFAAAYRDPDHLASGAFSRLLPARAPVALVLHTITADVRLSVGR